MPLQKLIAIIHFLLKFCIIRRYRTRSAQGKCQMSLCKAMTQKQFLQKTTDFGILKKIKCYNVLTFFPRRGNACGEPILLTKDTQKRKNARWHGVTKKLGFLARLQKMPIKIKFKCILKLNSRNGQFVLVLCMHTKDPQTESRKLIKPIMITISHIKIKLYQ